MTPANRSSSPDARGVLDSLERLSRESHVSDVWLATVLGSIGELDAAFERLESSYQNRSEYMLLLVIDPTPNPLRRDPRFADLVRRVGLPGGTVPD